MSMFEGDAIPDGTMMVRGAQRQQRQRALLVWAEVSIEVCATRGYTSCSMNTLVYLLRTASTSSVMLS